METAAVDAISAVKGTSFHIYGGLIDISEDELRRNRVIYKGLIKPETVAEIMGQYDLLLFPTRHHGEGYPGTLVEAAMVGLPIIASKWRSLPEMFPDGELFFIEPSNSEEITAMLQYLLANPHLLLQKSAKLISRSLDFDSELVFSRFLAICNGLMSR